MSNDGGSDQRKGNVEAPFALRIFDAELPPDEDWQRAYRADVRDSIMWFIVAGKYAAQLVAVEDFTKEQGWKPPIYPPDLSLFDISDPQSELCKFIRKAVSIGFLTGDEQWLRPANWRTT